MKRCDGGRKAYLVAAILTFAVCRAFSFTIGFESLPVPEREYWNGDDGSSGFVENWAHFGNYYDDTWGPYWEGFAYSRVVDTNTAGFLNQYAVWTPGTGVNGSETYAVVSPSSASVVRFPFAVTPQGFFVNNTTYAALDMMHGSMFSRVFEEGDWFLLTVTGQDAAGNVTGSVEFYLADFRSSDPTEHYIIGEWVWLDLTSLGPAVKSLQFALTSSDVGDYGMNTPSYFAMDDLTVAPMPGWQIVDFSDLTLPERWYWNGDDWSGGFESDWVDFNNYYDDTWGPYWAGFAYSQVDDVTTEGFENQYAVWTPGVAATGETYAVVHAGWASTLTFPFESVIDGFYVNNTTYAALSMLHGDMFAKQFGGPDGTDEDWFLLTVTGMDADGNETGSVEFYLADYRFGDPSENYLVDAWTWLDLRPLGPAVKSLRFGLTSSDVGDYGMNTPSYFAMDGLRWMGGFSAGLASDTVFDAAVPGFTGLDGDGISDGAMNTVNQAFAGWAEEVIAYEPALGISSDWTNTVNALGPVTGNNGNVVSLGEAEPGEDAGFITLRMSASIMDKDGPDFVVFENTFGTADSAFAELAFVEVSSDGENFVRFPSVSLTPDEVPFWGAAIDPRKIYNLAGKHVNAYGDSWGTPFDLAVLAGHPDVLSGLLDLSSVEYIRIVDVPGDGRYTDSLGNPIYDPYPTSGSGGFDLEAIGVLNSPEYHRVRTRVHGPGRISPYGQPDGIVAVEHGGSLRLDVIVDDGYHLVDVLVDGVSFGAVTELDLSNVTEDRLVEAVFGSRLTVISEHGEPYPAVGDSYHYGELTLLMNDTIFINGTTQYVAVGWVDGSGNIAGTGDDFELTVNLDQDSAITWLWQTNYWLEVAYSGEGRVTTESGWMAAYSNVTLTAHADPWFDLLEWTGDVQGNNPASESINVIISAPLTLTATFGAEDMSTQRVPASWLAEYGFYDGNTVDEAALEVDPVTGMSAWQAFYAGVMPGDASTLFRIIDMGREEDTFYVTWFGGTNGSQRPFTVQGREGLGEGTGWFTLEGLVERSPTGTNTWWSNGGLSNLFFRVTVDMQE